MLQDTPAQEVQGASSSAVGVHAVDKRQQHELAEGMGTHAVDLCADAAQHIQVAKLSSTCSGAVGRDLATKATKAVRAWLLVLLPLRVLPCMLCKARDVAGQ